MLLHRRTAFKCSTPLFLHSTDIHTSCSLSHANWLQCYQGIWVRIQTWVLRSSCRLYQRSFFWVLHSATYSHWNIELWLGNEDHTSTGNYLCGHGVGLQGHLHFVDDFAGDYKELRDWWLLHKLSWSAPWRGNLAEVAHNFTGIQDSYAFRLARAPKS